MKMVMITEVMKVTIKDQSKTVFEITFDFCKYLIVWHGFSMNFQKSFLYFLTF